MVSYDRWSLNAGSFRLILEGLLYKNSCLLKQGIAKYRWSLTLYHGNSSLSILGFWLYIYTRFRALQHSFCKQCRSSKLSLWPKFAEVKYEAWFPQNITIVDLKDFKGLIDNFKFDKNGRMLSKWVENNVGKGEIPRKEQFLLFPQCFQKASRQICKKQGLFRKGFKTKLYLVTRKCWFPPLHVMRFIIN